MTYYFTVDDVPMMKCAHCAEWRDKQSAALCLHCERPVCETCAKQLAEDRQDCPHPRANGGSR